MLSPKVLGSTKLFISLIDMFSTPPAIPQSTYPQAIEYAKFITACNPDEHSLFIVINVVVSGSPAKN